MAFFVYRLVNGGYLQVVHLFVVTNMLGQEKRVTQGEGGRGRTWKMPDRKDCQLFLSASVRLERVIIRHVGRKGK